MLGVGGSFIGDHMYRPYFFLIDMGALTLLLMACGTQTTEPKTVKVTEDDDNSSLDLRVTDVLEVTLESNPTTGYQWEMIGDVSYYLRQLGKVEYEPRGNSMGSGGSNILRFEAIRTGKMKLEFVYRQPFNKEGPAEKSFGLFVTITK